MKRIITLIFAVIILTSSIALPRPKRVNQIPNGNVNRCANCHVDPNGGGPRNLFGQLIEAKYLTQPGSAGDVIWGPELAHEDADGDGFTNGEELQDSAGIWTGGAIGDPTQVFLPGDPNSHPPATSVHLTNQAPNNFELKQNYPNPFNPTTTISFSIPNATYIKLVVFDALGRKVEELINKYLNQGNYEVNFNAENLNSGIYFYKISAGKFSKVKRMLLLK